jgi:iron complex transport system substrate-binding protein
METRTKKKEVLMIETGRIVKAGLLGIILAALIVLAGGCGMQTAPMKESRTSAQAAPAPEIPGISFIKAEENQYSEEFRILDYTDGFHVIEIPESREAYLVVPEGGKSPAKLPEHMTVLSLPLTHIYLADTAAMALFDAVDAVSRIRFSSIRQDQWYIPEAVDAMKAGDILFAGKYSQPDYETLMLEGCDLAIESTMINHSPEVKEQLTELHIPVFTDYSSYESDPMGRVEWVRVYGLLSGKAPEAEAFLKAQSAKLEELMDTDPASDAASNSVSDPGSYSDPARTETGTFAYFYLNSSGQAVIRSADDYIPAMFQMGGLSYVFKDLKSPDRKASITIGMEDFYHKAKDADYLIYNGFLGALPNVEELINRSSLFQDFKAVRDGQVYTTSPAFYQRTDAMADFIRDVHLMSEGEAYDMTFISKVE